MYTTFGSLEKYFRLMCVEKYAKDKVSLEKSR